MSISKIVVTLFVLICVMQSVMSAGPKIVNGELAVKGQFPFIVQLFNKTANYNFCGGTSIGPYHILTAAHCIDGASASEVQIWAGALNLGDADGYKVNVDAIYKHPNYNSAKITNDVAVVKLVKPFPRSIGLRTIEMATSNVAVGTVVTAAGWGSTGYGGTPGYGIYPEDLMFVKFDVISGSVCAQSFGTFLVPSQEVCAYDAAVGTCFGDSGGPLFTGSKTTARQHGVTSYVSGNGCATAPSVFARVPYYRDWIVGKTVHTITTSCVECSVDTEWKQLCQGIGGTWALTASSYQCKNVDVDKTKNMGSYSWSECLSAKAKDLCEKIGRYSCNAAGESTCTPV